jgi:hypothetical protein
MSFEFELTDLGLDRAFRRAQNIIDEVRDSLKDGSGRIPDSLKVYNRYYDGIPITAKQYVENADIRDEVEHTVLMILATKWQIDRIFNIDIEDKDAAKVANPLFYDNELEEELEKRVEHYQTVLHAIRTAHSITEAKLKTTMMTLEALDAEIPKVLKTAIYVRENYAKNQLRKALADAVKTIFPSIENKKILNQIAAQAM